MRSQSNPICLKNRLAAAFLLPSVLLGTLPPAAAQTADETTLAEFYGSAEMVSIATGVAQPLRQSPAIASVITAADIAAIGATELNEVLETVPGLHVGVSGVGYKPIFSIRGIHTQTNPQVLVLVNGIPIKNVFDGSLGASWGRMPVTGIARIEVIRGPGSALYGADAFSGVINIITKSADVEGWRSALAPARSIVTTSTCSGAVILANSMPISTSNATAATAHAATSLPMRRPPSTASSVAMLRWRQARCRSTGTTPRPGQISRAATGDCVAAFRRSTIVASVLAYRRRSTPLAAAMVGASRPIFPTITPRFPEIGA